MPQFEMTITRIEVDAHVTWYVDDADGGYVGLRLWKSDAGYSNMTENAWLDALRHSGISIGVVANGLHNPIPYDVFMGRS